MNESLLTAFDWTVLWPLLTLVAGTILCFLLGAFAPKNRHAPSLAFLAIAGAFALQGQLWKTGAGSAFRGLLLADSSYQILGASFLLLTAIAWGFSVSYLRDDEPRSEFYGLLLLAPAGMMLMAGAQNLLLLFLGIEILSIPLYLLCAFRHGRDESVESGLKYFLLGAFAAAFLLLGIALLYAATGSVDLIAIRAAAETLAADRQLLLRGGLAMLAIGLLFKASLAPFHFWTPDVYEGAPTPVTALMAAGTKAAAFAALLHIAPMFTGNFRSGLIAAALLTLVIGNFGALLQNNLKRMLAYSSVAHAGVLLIGVLAFPAAESAREAVLFYLIAYGFTVVGAFGCLAALQAQEGEHVAELDNLRGLSRRRPWQALALTLFLLSLGGMPPTAGFLGKYLVFAAAIDAEMTWLAVAGILFSVVALGYYLRIIVAMYMLPSASKASAPSSSDWQSRLATVAAALAVLAFGIQPSWLLRLV